MDRSLQRKLSKTNYQHIKRLCRGKYINYTVWSYQLFKQNTGVSNVCIIGLCTYIYCYPLWFPDAYLFRPRTAVWGPGFPAQQQGNLQPQETRTSPHPMDAPSCEQDNWIMWMFWQNLLKYFSFYTNIQLLKSHLSSIFFWHFRRGQCSPPGIFHPVQSLRS